MLFLFCQARHIRQACFQEPWLFRLLPLLWQDYPSGLQPLFQEWG